MGHAEDHWFGMLLCMAPKIIKVINSIAASNTTSGVQHVITNVKAWMGADTVVEYHQSPQQPSGDNRNACGAYAFGAFAWCV